MNKWVYSFNFDQRLSLVFWQLFIEFNFRLWLAPIPLQQWERQFDIMTSKESDRPIVPIAVRTCCVPRNATQSDWHLSWAGGFTGKVSVQRLATCVHGIDDGAPPKTQHYIITYDRLAFPTTTTTLTHCPRDIMMVMIQCLKPWSWSLSPGEPALLHHVHAVHGIHLQYDSQH